MSFEDKSQSRHDYGEVKMCTLSQQDTMSFGSDYVLTSVSFASAQTAMRHERWSQVAIVVVAQDDRCTGPPCPVLGKM